MDTYEDDGDTPNGIKGYRPSTGEHKASLISVLIPYGTGERLSNPLEILAQRPYVHEVDFDQKIGHGDGIKRASFMDADVVSRLFNLDEYVKSADDAENFLAYERSCNTICYRGHRFSYDVTSEQHAAVTVNTGHWGPNVYPGCGRVRAGEMKYFEKVDYKCAVTSHSTRRR
jgi:hypothetical protein